MGSHKISSSLFCSILLAIFYPSQTQNSQQDYLDTHNAAREQVGVGPITRDDTVAAYAQNYANQRMNDCNFVHSGGQYGENLATNMWVNEKTNYDYNSNSRIIGGVCGHYTQVVWANSVRLGCARVQCTNINGGLFVICSYDPPGNVIGQRPYSLWDIFLDGQKFVAFDVLLMLCFQALAWEFKRMNKAKYTRQ